MKKQNRTLLYLFFAAILVLAVVVLVSRNNDQSQTAFLEKYQLNGLTVEEMVFKLDSTTQEDSNLRSSITSEELILTDDSQEIRLPLPEGKFYLSFAPYLNQTHPCATHSLTTCRGELVGQPIHALVRDDSGNILLDADYVTMENGFTGIWLPADISATLEVTYGDLKTSAPILTAAGSDTCLTTPLQLN